MDNCITKLSILETDFQWKVWVVLTPVSPLKDSTVVGGSLFLLISRSLLTASSQKSQQISMISTMKDCFESAAESVFTLCRKSSYKCFTYSCLCILNWDRRKHRNIKMMHFTFEKKLSHRFLQPTDRTGSPSWVKKQGLSVCVEEMSQWWSVIAFEVSNSLRSLQYSPQVSATILHLYSVNIFKSSSFLCFALPVSLVWIPPDFVE